MHLHSVFVGPARVLQLVELLKPFSLSDVHGLLLFDIDPHYEQKAAQVQARLLDRRETGAESKTCTLFVGAVGASIFGRLVDLSPS